MSITDEEIRKVALPWKPQLPPVDGELEEKLRSFFDEDGNLTPYGRDASVRPGIYIAAIP